MFRISSDGSSASTVSILAALSQLAGNPYFLPGPVNLSFGSPPPNTLNADPSIQSVAQQLQARGCLLVLAAGNDGVADNSPELYARRVGAVNADGSRAYFSEYGPFFAGAPGVQVPTYTPASTGAEAFGSGTSFAAPRWCAAIADVMGVLSPGARTAVYADQIVHQTGTSTSSGFVIPNVSAALNAAYGH